MQKSLIYFFAIIALFSLGLNVYLIFNLKKSSSPNPQKSRISLATRIIDGDTFDTEEGERIRLYEIDAPHFPKGCMGTDAKVRLEELLLNKNIIIENIKKDNFGRTCRQLQIF